jgi:hypothetical protein
MDVIKQLEAQGYQLTIEGQNIRCRLVEKAAPDKVRVQRLIEELKQRKFEVIEYLKAKFDLGRNPGFAILCPYKGEPRWIHPAVCQWHREESDAECSGCDPNKRPKQARQYH